jgi:4-amino-4-deoxy-L-arabinose transferase-like glycosyltransferase
MSEPPAVESGAVPRTTAWRPARAWSGYLPLVAILGLALGLRLAYVAGLPAGSAFGSVDARGYHQLALNLLESGSFTPQNGSPSLLGAIRTPLYPTFLAPVLALAGDAGRAVPLAQALLDTGTVALVYGLGRQLAGPRSGWIAALLYAVNPISFLLVGEALTEVLLAFLLALTFLLFVAALQAGRKGYGLLILTGLASGLAILCKPNVLALPIILALGIAVWRRPSWRTVREMGLLAGTALLVLLPWLVRNRLVFGEWFLSLAFDDNLAHVSAVATVAEVQGEKVAPWTPRWEELYMTHVVVPARDRYGWEESGEPLALNDALQRHHQMAAVAADLIRRHPVAFLAAHARGVVHSLVPSMHRSWYGYLTGRPWPQAGSLADTLAAAGGRLAAGGPAAAVDLLRAWWQRLASPAWQLWLASMIVSLLGSVLLAAGLWRLREQPAVLLSMGLVLLYLLLLPGPIAYLRFWMPGVPLACVIVAYRSQTASQSTDLSIYQEAAC